MDRPFTEITSGVKISVYTLGMVSAEVDQFV
jgi:hypothetical protein